MQAGFSATNDTVGSGKQQTQVYSDGTVTTELIQKYLDENKQLILSVLENHTLGNVNDCVQYQARLQQNLMYLAALADNQSSILEMPTHSPTQGVTGNRLTSNQQAMSASQSFANSLGQHQSEKPNH